MSLEQKNGVAMTTQDILTHHLNSLAAGDLDSIMADYTAESRLFTPEGLLRGPEAIRSLFVKVFEEFAQPGAFFEVLRQEVDGDTAYIVSKGETADTRYEFSTDTFIVQNGKIVTQTWAAKASPKR